MSETNRRDLLKLFGTAGAAAVAAPVLAAAANAEESPEEMRKERYQESDHVKRFYALLRL